MRKVTEKQEKLCHLVIQNEQTPDQERLKDAELYALAGYSSKTPRRHVAVELQKEHIQSRLSYLRAVSKGETPPTDDGIISDTELEKILCKHAKNNAQAAAKLAEIRMKREATGGGMDVTALLLSPFLSESELDQMRDDKPQDVVVAGSNNNNSEPVAETSMNTVVNAGDE